MRVRAPALALVVLGVVMTAGFAGSWLGYDGAPRAPWWAYLFLTVLSVALVALAGAVTIEPGSLVPRRALAGSALGWLVFLVSAIALRLDPTSAEGDLYLLIALAAVDGAALVGLAATTADEAAGRSDPVSRLGAVVVFGIAIVMAAGAAVVVVSLGRTVWRIVTDGQPIDRLPVSLLIIIAVLPLVTFLIASVGARRAAGGTFHAQAAANRRNTVLLLITMVGIVAAVAEIIAFTLTFSPAPALWAAAIATAIGLATALLAGRFGANVILETAGARRADPKYDAELLDIVRELSIAANVPMPTTYVVEDGSQNAFATGRDPDHAAVAVTRGLLQTMDREQVQGIIGHELGHIRNLDIRYGLYVAVLVGLVALATDGFLRLVIEGWKQGAFFWKSDDKSVVATLAMGLLVGLFLLIVASLLRVFAPLASALVQASTSREREFLADATSVEFTRNPRALERALASLAADTDTLDGANRGTQHLWFRNPVKAGSDRRAGLLSTHPSLAARIDRLRRLQGLDPLDVDAAAAPAAET